MSDRFRTLLSLFSFPSSIALSVQVSWRLVLLRGTLVCFLQHLRPAPFTALQRTGIGICSPACSVVTEPRPIVGCSFLLVVALLIHTFISLRLSVSVSILVSVTKGRVPMYLRSCVAGSLSISILARYTPEQNGVVTFLRHDEKITSTKLYELVQIFVNSC